MTCVRVILHTAFDERTSINVFSKSHPLPSTGDCGGAPALGLNVPGSVHLGYSSNKRAHSLRFTSNMSSMSMRLDRRMNPTGVAGSGVIFETVNVLVPF